MSQSVADCRIPGAPVASGEPHGPADDPRAFRLALKALFLEMVDAIDLSDAEGPAWSVYLDRLEEAERQASYRQLEEIRQDFARWRAGWQPKNGGRNSGRRP
jgi:hypothetical protein